MKSSDGRSLRCCRRSRRRSGYATHTLSTGHICEFRLPLEFSHLTSPGQLLFSEQSSLTKSSRPCTVPGSQSFFSKNHCTQCVTGPSKACGITTRSPSSSSCSPSQLSSTRANTHTPSKPRSSITCPARRSVWHRQCVRPQQRPSRPWCVPPPPCCALSHDGTRYTWRSIGI